ncbi:hypothetical protein R6Q57_004786 [Mikania cordata]
MASSIDLQETLKPFHQRASDAEISKEMQRVIDENAKLRYRITHLVRALEKADSDLALK